MMTTSDLRIGNWLYESECTRYPMYVHTIGDDYVYLNFDGNEGDVWECKPEELQGIPLTDDLMEKLGFSYKDGLWRHQWGIKVKPDAGFVNIENKDKENWLYGTCNCKDIWYLHQLQNLIAIITKKELKIDIWNK